MGFHSGITLAICTYNGRSRLKPTLEHILSQQNTADIEWELLVIDNASTDGTAEFIKEYWPNDQLHQLRIIREEKLGAIHARQRAIQEARYNYLSYIDDDNWISSNWVAEIYRIFENQPTVGIISCPSKANLSQAPPTYFEGLKGWLAIGARCPQEGIIKDRPMSFWTAGLSLRLQAFKSLENTSYAVCLTGRTGKQTYGGEDHELCLTLTLMGWDIYYTHNTLFTHDIPPSRLTEAYLERLIQNGGKSRTILDIYRNEYRQPAFYYPYLSILGYFWYLGDRTLKYWCKRLIGKASEPLNPNRTSYLHAIGRVQSYFIHFKRIAQAQRNIQLLRSLNTVASSSD
ncbi:MAG: glycosyltransferase [Cyanobacteria bacterium P01_F01_bin.150]